MLQYIQKFFKKSVAPISQNEDDARRELILNILLLSIIVLSFSAFVISLIGHLLDGLDASIPTSIILIIFSFFVFLYFLSRKGFYSFASYVLIIVLSLPVTYQVYKWGVDLPISLLAYAVIIIMAGVLISTRAAFVVSIIISFAIIIIGYFQTIGAILVDRYWVSEIVSLADLIMVSLLFTIIATVSWLSNREIEKSLTRARKSEAELKEERDSLEVTVEERTRELKETQAEKMTQLYRFAEFGRLSSGLFHDLINPLTAVSLNIERVKNAGETKQYVNKAISAARKMEDMVSAVRKQLSRQETKKIFSLNKEIEYVIEVLTYKARKANIDIRFVSKRDVEIFGDAVKFNQVVLNLVANAIDSGGKMVQVFLTNENNEVILSVQDNGVGISDGNIGKIFEPFFTTKEEEKGMGIGLSIVKRIIEKDFGGSISVESKEGEWATFTIRFPQKQNE